MWKIVFVKSWLAENITYGMGSRIKLVAALTKVQNTVGVVKLETYQRTVVIIRLVDIIQIPIKKLGKSDAYFFFRTNINLI